MAKTTKARTPRVKAKVVNQTETPKEKQVKKLLSNGLSDALGLSGGVGPFGPGVQLSQTDTMFKNLRWSLISNQRNMVSQAYAELGPIKTIVDVPVEDAFRGGVDIATKQLSEDQLDQLHSTMARERDLNIVAQANKWKRLFGGAGIVIVTGQEPSTPLMVESLTGTRVKFRACDMWELFFTQLNVSDTSAIVDAVADAEFFDYYSVKLHSSRVIKLKGEEAPSQLRPRLRGWGMSVLEQLVRSVNQYLKATDLSFEVLDEFKLDIFKVKNLTSALFSPEGEEMVRRRISLANRQKNYQNALTMDSEDDYVQKQLSFSGLAEVMQGIRTQMASDMRIPQAKLFGQSATGFSSGEDDIENYNAMVESSIRQEATFEVLKIVEIRCQQLFGMVPDDLIIGFKPLRILSAKDEEEVKTSKFNRLLQAQQAGLISAHDFKEACNRDDLLPVQLDPDEEQLPPAGAETGSQPDDEADAEEPGDGKKAPPGKDKADNSLGYDMAAYAADGGEARFSPYEERYVTNPDPRKINIDLMAKAKRAAVEAFGEERWQFVLWYYKQHGGKLT